jgi:hypothetical protein
MKNLAIMLCIVLCVVGCGKSTDLSRPKAKEIIEAAPIFKSGPAVVRLTPDLLAKGEQEGLWNGAFMTPKGERIFSGWGPESNVIKMRDNMSRSVIDVTGISASPFGESDEKSKWVNFTWNWNLKDLSPEAQQFLGNYPPRKYNALLKLFDDGWRLEGFYNDDGSTSGYWQ